MNFYTNSEITFKELSLVYKRALWPIVFTFCLALVLQIISIYILFTIKPHALKVGATIMSFFCFTFIFMSAYKFYLRAIRSDWLIGYSNNIIYIKFSPNRFRSMQSDYCQILSIDLSEVKAINDIHITDIIRVGRIIKKKRKYIFRYISV